MFLYEGKAKWKEYEDHRPTNWIKSCGTATISTAFTLVILSSHLSCNFLHIFRKNQNLNASFPYSSLHQIVQNTLKLQHRWDTFTNSLFLVEFSDVIVNQNWTRNLLTPIHRYLYASSKGHLWQNAKFGCLYLWYFSTCLFRLKVRVKRSHFLPDVSFTVQTISNSQVVKIEYNNFIWRHRRRLRQTEHSKLYFKWSQLKQKFICLWRNFV